MGSDTKVHIYALVDPRDGSVRYIGKAINAQKRFKQHLGERKRKYPVYAWIGKLRSMGLVPRLEVMRVCGEADWQAVEREEIAKLNHTGRLLNVAEGGEQPFCPLSVRAENGRNNAASRESTPTKRRIWMLKQRMGLLLKDGCASEAVKAKLRRAAMMRPELFGQWALL